MIASRPGRPVRPRDVVLVMASVTMLVLPAVRADGQAGFRFRSGVDLINVSATVTDRSGRFAPGLTQSDFVVYEDDRPVEVTLFSAERVPVSLGIILDTSGSMQGDKMESALAAIESFVGRLFNADDEVFLSGFSSDVDLIQEWTTDRNVIVASLRRVRAMGGTAMYDAVVEGVPMAHGGRNRKKAVVLISDGNDTNSRTGIGDVRQVVRQSEVMVYAIGIDGQGEPTTTSRPPIFPRGRSPFPVPGRGQPRVPWPSPPQLPSTRGRGAEDRLNVAALREITDDTGGRTEVIRSGRDLESATASIADELSRQYYIGYASSGHRDGRWHTIRVEVRDKSLLVRARRGYLAAS